MPHRPSLRALTAACLAALALATSAGVTPYARHASAATVSVEASNDNEINFFEPAEINIAPGDTVEWNWTGDVVHDVVSNPGDIEVYGSGILPPGSTFSHTFTHAGAFTYICSLHAEMTGSVTVAAETPGTWTPTGDMGTPRGNDASALLQDGTVLTIGGVDGNAVAQASVERYSPGVNAWSPSDGLASPRADHTATTLDTGEVLIVSGAESSTLLLRTSQRYDPGLQSWSAAGDLAGVRRYHEATLLGDGRVLVTGGETKLPFGGAFLTSSAEVYERGSDGWNGASSMNAPRVSHTATLLNDGRVLVAGGFDGNNTLDSADLYDPVNNVWLPAASMDTTRAGAAAVRLPDGRVLVTGGDDFISPDVRASAEIYDPALDEWTPSSPMHFPRSFHTATLLGDGRVLVAGGFDGLVSLSDAEIYDPATGEWFIAPSMTVGRSGHDALALLDGRVIVIGGTNVDATVAHAEVFFAGAPGDDGDGIPPDEDNCPDAYNPPQTNTDAAPLRDEGANVDDTTIANADSSGDACDSDDDNDFLSDTEETAGCNGSGPLQPLLADSDGDRIIDGIECLLSSDPGDPVSRPPLPPQEEDTDGDTLSDSFEDLIGSDHSVVDTDLDGVPDAVEVKGYGTSPNNTDTDEDGCDDGQEIGSVDNQSAVNSIDLLLVAQRFLNRGLAVHDVNKSGNIDSLDLLLVARNFNPASPC